MTTFKTIATQNAQPVFADASGVVLAQSPNEPEDTYLMVEERAHAHWPRNESNMRLIGSVTGLDLRIRTDDRYSAAIYALDRPVEALAQS